MVYPVPGEAEARRLRLGDLALVVGELEVYPPSVQVKPLPQVLEAHGGALNVPAGVALPPGAFPAHEVPGLGGLPEGEVQGVLLLLPHLHPGPRPQLLGPFPGKLPVLGEGPDPEVDASFPHVGQPLLQKPLYELPHLRDVARSPGGDGGPEDVQGP